MTTTATQHKILVGGVWRDAATVGTFHAENPTTAQRIEGAYPISSREDILAAIEAGYEASRALRELPPEHIAAALEAFADLIEAHADELVDLAHEETGLPREPRLRNVELPRTTGQLRQAAHAARTRSWKLPTIDTTANIRSLHGSLPGPVVVFGPNNFPFAFNSAAGGDFAAALATGHAVIAKANTSHPGTTRRLTELADQACREAGLPSATVQLLYRTTREDGLTLVSHEKIAATGFTGSRSAGLTLKAAADRAGKPIYLEMSSVNPVFVLTGALQTRGEDIAREFFTSCTLGAGQFCTNPGLVILPDNDEGRAFVERAAELFGSATPGVLLGKGGLDGLTEAVRTWQAHGATLLVGGEPSHEGGYRFRNTLLTVDGATFTRNASALQHEAFGPCALLVLVKSEAELLDVTASLEGNLTGTIYADRDRDTETYARLERALRPKVGRLLNDRMPTGVAVSAAMNHGGPYPATGHPGFTAVGIPAALRRFSALYCYDNIPEERLPPELQDGNPLGIQRYVDGEWR